MGRGASVVREPRLNDDLTDAWTREIRDYLLGRLAKNQQTISLTAPCTQRLSHVPILRWWIFEGKRYSSVGGTLSTRWLEVIRLARLLERTFNPRLKFSDRPDGAIDWGRTLARGPGVPYPEYVLNSSGVGLGEEERDALRGWLRWIGAHWAAYADQFELALPPQAQQFFQTVATQQAEAATVEQLHRWAHVARRSRWPLLRDLVAETLRAALEPDALDHIPLPIDRPTLFELLCLVRIARQIAPSPDELRWLDRELTENKITFPGATCWYQQKLERDAVLKTPDFEELAEVASMFGLRVPERIDLAFDLVPARNAIDGIIVEAKSGGQGFDAAVAQLRVYRKARPRNAGRRYLVWGVVEQSTRGSITQVQLDWLRHEIQHGNGDVWVFSTADDIASVLALLRSP